MSSKDHQGRASEEGQGRVLNSLRGLLPITGSTSPHVTPCHTVLGAGGVAWQSSLLEQMGAEGAGVSTGDLCPFATPPSLSPPQSPHWCQVVLWALRCRVPSQGAHRLRALFQTAGLGGREREEAGQVIISEFGNREVPLGKGSRFSSVLPCWPVIDLTWAMSLLAGKSRRVKTALLMAQPFRVAGGGRNPGWGQANRERRNTEVPPASQAKALPSSHA